MGYPMTWRRVINRNLLHDGDYNSPPDAWRVRVNTNDSVPNDAKDLILNARKEELKKSEQRSAFLAGDIRRLEKDVLDENSICKIIGARTSLSVDDVAAVLKEFFSI